MNIAAMIASTVAILGLVGGGYAWDYQQKTAQHHEIMSAVQARDLDLELQRVELELRFLRDIESRRSLTPDELDRRRYLEDLRRVLLEKQRGG